MQLVLICPIWNRKIFSILSHNNIALPGTNIPLESEYWFYEEGEVSGIPDNPFLPGLDSNSWEEVYSIPVDLKCRTKFKHTFIRRYV